MSNLPPDVVSALLFVAGFFARMLLERLGIKLPWFNPAPAPVPVPVQAVGSPDPLMDELWASVDHDVKKQLREKIHEVAKGILGQPVPPKP